MDENLKNSSIKPFLLGLSISIVVIVSFFVGAVSDRLFVIKPLDFLIGRSAGVLDTTTPAPENDSKLGQLLRSNENVSIPDVSEVASESVVTVSIKTQQRILERDPQDPFGLFNMGTSRVEEVEQDIGTGFVVDQSGLIVTNRHVVSNSGAEYKVSDKDGKEYSVEQIYRDPTNDLAILKISGANLPTLALGDSDKIRVGESVIAIGTALGEFRHTVTTGVISGLGRGITAGDGFYETEELDNVIQTDAAINPGNSGGPLLNTRGEVIGVNVAVSANAQNIGFALPINVVKASIDNFNQTGQFDRPFLGVSYIPLSMQQALQNNVPQGAYLNQVVANSSAAEAGLKEGDIIISIDNIKMKDTELSEVINKKKVGDVLTIKIYRDEQEQDIKVTLKSATQAAGQ